LKTRADSARATCRQAKEKWGEGRLTAAFDTANQRFIISDESRNAVELGWFKPTI
jgi:hypothetical protein